MWTIQLREKENDIPHLVLLMWLRNKNLLVKSRKIKRVLKIFVGFYF